MPKTIADFKPDDRVRYIPNHAFLDRHHKDCEDGVVSSTNDYFVFVRYGTSQTAQATDPENLIHLH